MKLIQSALLLCLLLPFGSFAAAPASVTVKIGDGTIAIPAPDELVNPVFKAPHLAKAATPLMTAPGLRLLGVFILPSQLERYLEGEVPDLQRYSVVQTPHILEELLTTKEAFENMKARIRTRTTAEVESIRKAAQLAVEDKARVLGEKTGDDKYSMSLDSLENAGVFDETPTSISTASHTTYTAKSKGKIVSAPVVYSTTAVLVKGKVISLYVYSRFNGEADVAWVKGVALQWKQGLEQANPPRSRQQ